MKKLILFAASAVAVLASCTQNEEFNSPVANNETPISFGTYLGRGTRAAATGNITTAQVLAQKGGFGVFAYYTESTKYTAGQTAYAPNFMNNQKVEGTNDASPVWSYTPLKYWPNANSTTADNIGAVGEEGGLVSFFAYGPYADAAGTTGITKLPTKSDKTDPVIEYTMAANGENVDLLWGTSNTTSSIAGTTTGQSNEGTANTGETLTGGKGKVNANLTKQKVDGKIGFNFKHALAKLGGSGDDATDAKTGTGLQVVLGVAKKDGSAITGEALDAATKVTIQSITVTNDLQSTDATANEAAKKSFASKGSLNLATGAWTVASTDEGATFTSTIGKAGETGVTATIKDNLLYTSTLASLPTGVTTTAQNVYKEETNPIVMIPGTTPQFKITIKYNVTTADAALDGGYSDVTNTITKTITFPTEVEMNKMYNIVLRLGLTDVKVEATVADWENGSSATDPDATDPNNTDGGVSVNLPINVQ